jgi:hypothetical protein
VPREPIDISWGSDNPMTAEFVHVREELSERECRRLLETVSIGRIGFSERALPMILPVRFRVRGGEVVTLPFAASQISSSGRGDVVVFEADCVDPVTREGWVVTVIGRARLIADPTEIAALPEFDVPPSTSDDGRHLAAVRMELVRGSRVQRQPTMVAHAGPPSGGPVPRPAA